MLNFFIMHSPLLYLTQSLWRDEAFSILVGEKSIITLFTKLSFEPPLYYLLLHFWMKLFGTGEVAVRSLSLLGLVLATIVVIHWAEELFPRSWLWWYAPVFFITNPMLIYYGIEVRTYGWYIFFATLSMYAYLTKRWKIHTLSIIAGFYTHTYFLFGFFVQIVHHILTYKRIHFRDPMIRSSGIALLAMTPWFVKIISEASKLKSSWYFPVDIHLIQSVLGNLYIGYEGTPWFLWPYTAVLSLILLIVFVYALKNKKTRHTTSFFFLNIFIPLFIVIGISFFKPLYVNRYLISVTISEIFLLVLAIQNIKNISAKISIALVFLLSNILFNFWYPAKHAKFPYRDTMQEVNTLVKPGDVIYATSSLNYFETVYYSKDKTRVYLFNPTGSAFPWYVGDAAFDASRMAYSIPQYPKRAILVSPDGSLSIQFSTVLNPVPITSHE